MNQADLESFLAQARAAGEVNDEGAFTLDYAQARVKLASHQFQNPSDVYLKFVQVGTAMGAQSIQFRFSASETEIRFQAPSRQITGGAFAALITGVPGEYGDSLHNDLSYALCGSNTEVVEFVDTKVGNRVKVTKDGIDFFERGALKGDNKVLLRLIYPDKRNSRRLSLFRDQLAYRCQLAPPIIEVNGESLSHERLRLASHSKNLTPNFPYIWGESLGPLEGNSGIGLPLRSNQTWVANHSEGTVEKHSRLLGSSLVVLAGELKGRSRLHLIQNGVIIQTVAIDLPIYGADAYLCVDGLLTDFSGLRLRETPELEKRISHLAEQTRQLFLHCRAELENTEPKPIDVKSTKRPLSLISSMLVGGIGGLFVGGPFGSVAGVAAGTAFSTYLDSKRKRPSIDPHSYLRNYKLSNES